MVLNRFYRHVAHLSILLFLSVGKRVRTHTQHTRLFFSNQEHYTHRHVRTHPHSVMRCVSISLACGLKTTMCRERGRLPIWKVTAWDESWLPIPVTQMGFWSDNQVPFMQVLISPHKTLLEMLVHAEVGATTVLGDSARMLDSDLTTCHFHYGLIIHLCLTRTPEGTGHTHTHIYEYV